MQTAAQELLVRGGLRTPEGLGEVGMGQKGLGTPPGWQHPEICGPVGRGAATGTRRGTPNHMGNAPQEHGAPQIPLRITGLIKWG